MISRHLRYIERRRATAVTESTLLPLSGADCPFVASTGHACPAFHFDRAAAIISEAPLILSLSTSHEKCNYSCGLIRLSTPQRLIKQIYLLRPVRTAMIASRAVDRLINDIHLWQRPSTTGLPTKTHSRGRLPNALIAPAPQLVTSLIYS
jgi:hypothetical protein